MNSRSTLMAEKGTGTLFSLSRELWGKNAALKMEVPMGCQNGIHRSDIQPLEYGYKGVIHRYHIQPSEYGYKGVIHRYHIQPLEYRYKGVIHRYHIQPLEYGYVQGGYSQVSHPTLRVRGYKGVIHRYHIQPLVYGYIQEGYFLRPFKRIRFSKNLPSLTISIHSKC